MLLAIFEATINGRGITTGVFLGCAFLSRQLTIYSSIYLFAALLLNPRNADGRAKIREAVGFVFPVCFCIAAYLMFNWARFDSMFDTGYSRIILRGFMKSRVELVYSTQYTFHSTSYICFFRAHTLNSAVNFFSNPNP